MTGRIHDGDGGILPDARCGGGFDGNAACALNGERIGVRGAFVNAAGGFYAAAQVQDALGDGGLACVNVREDADVTDVHVNVFLCMVG